MSDHDRLQGGAKRMGEDAQDSADRVSEKTKDASDRMQNKAERAGVSDQSDHEFSI